MEAAAFIRVKSQPTFFETGTLFFEAEQVVPEKPDLTRLPAELRERVTFDPQTNTLIVRKPLTEEDKTAPGTVLYHARGKIAVEALYHASHGRGVKAERERGPFRVPVLAIRVDGQLELFEEGHFLEPACDFQIVTRACRKANSHRGLRRYHGRNRRD